MNRKEPDGLRSLMDYYTPKYGYMSSCRLPGHVPMRFDDPGSFKYLFKTIIDWSYDCKD